jgi:hypothetical protein
LRILEKFKRVVSEKLDIALCEFQKNTKELIPKGLILLLKYIV